MMVARINSLFVCLTTVSVTFTTSVWAVASSIGKGETAEEYHARILPLLQDAFKSQDETTAWWVGFAHPKHGDQYWVFGNSSSNGFAFPPDVPATIDDHFYIGSISKSFGATVNLKLIEDGKFGLDDTLESIAPDFVASFPQYANNTPADLMGMQTLVPDFLNNPDGFIANITEEPNHRFTIHEIIEFAMKDYPVKLPGEYAESLEKLNQTLGDWGIDAYYEYSTTNILAMEYIAENITGQSMHSLVSGLVTVPLGLNNTALPLRDAPQGVLPDPASRSYFGKSCVDEITKFGGNASIGDRDDDFVDSIVNFGSGGSMYSTIVDLLQWSKSGLGDSLLEPHTVEKRHKFKPTSLLLPYGLGLHLWVDALPPPVDSTITSDWFGHGGDALGSNARSYKNDKIGAAFASSVNSCNFSSLHGEAFKILLEDYKTNYRATDSPTKKPMSDSGQAAITTNLGSSLLILWTAVLSWREIT
ncbi:hypothetical protein ACHAWF_010203 [Thalassiosira exigua]